MGEPTATTTTLPTTAIATANHKFVTFTLQVLFAFLSLVLTMGMAWDWRLAQGLFFDIVMPCTN